MAKKKDKKPAKPPEHAWVQGRAEFDRMFGDLAFRRWQWMTISLVSMICCIVLAISIVILVTADRNIPWIVEVDELGQIRVSGEAATLDVPEHVRVAVLYSVLKNMREIPGDPQILNTMHRTALAHLHGDAGDFFARDVGRNAETIRSMVESNQRRYVKGVSSLLAFPGQQGLYRLTWTEELAGTQSNDAIAYEGLFQVRVGATHTDDRILLNPLGVYVTEYSYSIIETPEDP